MLVVPFGREGDDRAAARLRFLDVADHLLEHVIVRRDRDDRHLLVDERDRPVLHLAGRVALGVDVGDLLQLERALERDRVVDPAAEEQEVAALVEPLRDLLGHGFALQRLLDQQRQLRQRRRCAAWPPPALSVPRIWPRYIASRCSATSCVVNAFVDATPISGPGVRVDRAVRLARRHAADDVADGDAARALLLRLAQRRERVGGLARLGDHDRERVADTIGSR